MGLVFSMFNAGNSISNITNNINKNITNLVISSVQNSTTNLDQSQSLDIDCTDWVDQQTKGKIECVKEAADLIKSGKASPEEATQLCKIWEDGSCEANQVTMKGVMQTTITSDMSLSIKTYIQNNIKSSIDNAASQSGSGGFDNSVLGEVNSEIDNIQGVIQSYLQNDYSKISSSQTIKIKNGSVNFVTQDAFMDSFKNFTASNQVYTSSVNTIASAIKNSTSQDLGNSSIITIIIVIIIILIICAIIFWLWQNRKSKNTSAEDSLPSQNISDPPRVPSSKFPKHR